MNPKKSEEVSMCNKIKLFDCVAILLSVMLSFLFFAGYAMAGAPEKVDCQAEIEWDLTSEVSITNFGCKTGEHKKDPALIFTAELKNVSDKPLRYRINIFLLDMDKAAGHLVPRKGKPPVVEPGKSETVTIPFIKTSELSKKILVIVKTMGL